MVNLHPTLNTLCQVIPTKWRTYHDHRICDVLVVRAPGPIDANFHRAMVATAPGEKLLVGHRPARNWTRRTISNFFCAENYTCS